MCIRDMGMTVEQIEGYFKGISCNGRGTSCSDQLATAVRKAKDVYKRQMYRRMVRQRSIIRTMPR